MMKGKLIRLTAHDKTLGLLKGQINYISGEFDVILAANDTGSLKTLAENEGVDFRAVAMKREISLLSDLKSLFALIRLFRREKPDIVHANTPKGALLGMAAAKLAGVKHRLYNVNGLRFETTAGNLRRLLITMEKIACACATKIIPQSNGVAEVLRKEKITKKPLKVIHNGSGNGVDIARFDPADPETAEKARSLKGDHSTVTFVFMGRLVKDKGINELVGAFSRLTKEGVDARLFLLGRYEDNLDPIKKEIREEIERNDRIVECGFQKDIRPWLRASDVFVLPSYREGFPNVVLEALAMGLPCVVSDVNGAPDAVKEGLNGIIVPKKDEEALYQAMKKMAADGSLRAEMGENARPYVAERFNRPDVWRETLRMYRELDA